MTERKPPVPEVVQRAAAVLRQRSIDAIHRDPGGFAHVHCPLREADALRLAADLHAAGLLAT